jgi:hypothetical protein
MTDAMFRMEYIAANVGAELEWGVDVFIDEEIKITKGQALKVSGTPVPVVDCGEEYVYVKSVSAENYTTYKYDANKGIEGLEEGTYCVKYLYTNDNARKLVIKANFTPDTLSVYLTSNLYAGDDKNPATGTKVGTITIKVPRFLLSGSQELSMNMTGASTTPFEGSALASNAQGCDGEGIYAEIIEIIEGRIWYENIKEIIVENENDLESGDYVNVYAITYDGTIKKLDWDTNYAQKGEEMVKLEADLVYLIDNHGKIKYCLGDGTPTKDEGYYSGKIYFTSRVKKTQEDPLGIVFANSIPFKAYLKKQQ